MYSFMAYFKSVDEIKKQFYLICYQSRVVFLKILNHNVSSKTLLIKLNNVTDNIVALRFFELKIDKFIK